MALSGKILAGNTLAKTALLLALFSMNFGCSPGEQAHNLSVLAEQSTNSLHGEWQTAGSMEHSRYGHSAHCSGDSCYQVLVVGGTRVDHLGEEQILSAAEIYQPSTKSFRAETTAPGGARSFAGSAVAGDKLVYVGGLGVVNNEIVTLSSVLVYHPAEVTDYTLLALPLSYARAFSTVSYFEQSARLLVVGGCSDEVGVCRADFYNNAFQSTLSINESDLVGNATASVDSSIPVAAGIVHHTATVLGDERLLVAGGGSNKSFLYNPAESSWFVGAEMSSTRSKHTATRLQNGKVLVAGGLDANEEATQTAEIYDPMDDTWSAAAEMAHKRVGHSATRLADGRVLVVGGLDGEDQLLYAATVYVPEEDNWYTAGSVQDARAYHSATETERGVLIVGGLGAHGTLASAELFVPKNSGNPKKDREPTGGCSSMGETAIAPLPVLIFLLVQCRRLIRERLRPRSCAARL